MLLATGYEPTTTFDSKGPLGFETNKQTFYKLPKSSSFEDRIDAASILFRAHLNKRSFVAIGYERGGGESLARGQASHNASISFTPPRFGLKSNYTRIIPRPPPLIILEPRRGFLRSVLSWKIDPKTPLSEIIRRFL